MIYIFNSCKHEVILTADNRQCDSGEKISLELWCDGKSHCRDGSDESDRSCKGESNKYIIPLVILGVFVIGAVLVAFTLFCFFDTSRRKNINEQDFALNLTHETISKYLDQDLIQVFLKKRDFDQHLREEEKTILHGHYMKMRNQGIHLCFFELLKISGDPATSEKCISYAYQLEEDYLNCAGKMYVVFKQWSQSMSHNAELKYWVFSHIEQKFGYKIERWFYTNMLPLYSTCKYLNAHVLSNLLTLYKLSAAFIDIWKDLVIAIALRNFSFLLLVSSA